MKVEWVMNVEVVQGICKCDIMFCVHWLLVYGHSTFICGE